MTVAWRVRAFAVGVLLCYGSCARAQRAAEHVWADSALHAMRVDRQRDHKATVKHTLRMRAAFVTAGDGCAVAETDAFRSASFSLLGGLDSALVIAQRAQGAVSAACDGSIDARAQLAMALFQLQMGEFARVDSICTQALARCPTDPSAVGVRSGLLMNRAIARANQNDVEGATRAFREVLALGRSANSVQDIDDALSNLGVTKFHSGDLDSAEYFFRTALSADLATDNFKRAAKRYSNLTGVANRRGEFRKAVAYYDSAATLAERAGDLPLMVTIADGKAWSLAQMGDYRAAYEQYDVYHILQDSLIDIEKVRSLADVQEKYESEKKAKEILGLRADKLDAELVKAGLQRTRNIYLFAGISMLGVAFGLWGRLRFVHRSRAAIRKEKEISEGLLLNILPAEVAAELKAKGEAEARLIDEVTVLFTDFKGFTAMSEILGPKELVRDIHECFSAFDHIMTKYGIEKIKTIGDAYMAAGGLPVANNTHAVDVVQAALEIRDFIAEGKAQKIAQGLPYFEIRIGVHTGPVVAGIVGVKKFAYDIWGDTVNTASRMESSGEAGQVNISEATYALVKDVEVSSQLPDVSSQDALDPADRSALISESALRRSGSPATDNQQLTTRRAFTFTPRGKVQAKGKGEMEMYFVERKSADVHRTADYGG